MDKKLNDTEWYENLQAYTNLFIELYKICRREVHLLDGCIEKENTGNEQAKSVVKEAC